MLRWETANAFTTFSALYPAEFGYAIAFAHRLAKQFDPSDWHHETACFVHDLVPQFPTVQMVIRDAEERGGRFIF